MEHDIRSTLDDPAVRSEKGKCLVHIFQVLDRYDAN